MKHNRPGRPRHPDVLTPAEWRVLEVLRDGSTNAEIAARLGISRDTVKYHVSNMPAKLGLDDRRALAAWRPGAERGRLRGLFAISAVMESLARSVATVGLGVAAVAGVVVAVVAAVAVVAVVLVGGDGNGEFAALRPANTATPPPSPSAMAVASTPTATVTPSATTPPPTPETTPSSPAGGPAVTASPVPGRCTTSTDPTCVAAVYLGAPGDYAQVADIPAEQLLTRTSDGRYHVERGQQYTVVTAAKLPATGGWTRFYLVRDPGPTFGEPSPVSFSQLIKPIGTTYTFTVSEDDDPPGRFTYQLKAAKPFVRPRPDGKPQIGDVVVATMFQAPSFSYDSFDTTGAATAAGSYALLKPADDSDTEGTTTSVTAYDELRTEAVVLVVNVTDGDAKAQDGFYDEVEVDDTVEWRTAADCWVRMQVTEELTGTATVRKYAVNLYSHAYDGCTGTVSSELETEFRWVPPYLTAKDTAAGPFMHGPVLVTAGSHYPDRGMGSAPPAITWPPDPLPNPDLGEGWSGSVYLGYGGLEGEYTYRTSEGSLVLWIGRVRTALDQVHPVDPDDEEWTVEYRLLDGQPAHLAWWTTPRYYSSTVFVAYDLEHGVAYSFEGWGLLSREPELLVEIGRTFFIYP